jgi:hypothetical protein
MTITTPTKPRSAEPRSRETAIDLAVSIKAGKIAVVWKPDFEPNQIPSLPGQSAVRSYGFQWLDEEKTMSRAGGENPKGWVPAFKMLELLLPGLNWVDAKLLDEALAVSESRADRPIQARINSGAIRIYKPREDVVAPQGQIEEYSISDAEALVAEIFDADILRAAMRVCKSTQIVEAIQRQIELIETEGASIYGG